MLPCLPPFVQSFHYSCISLHSAYSISSFILPLHYTTFHQFIPFIQSVSFNLISANSFSIHWLSLVSLPAFICRFVKSLHSHSLSANRIHASFVGFAILIPLVLIPFTYIHYFHTAFHSVTSVPSYMFESYSLNPLQSTLHSFELRLGLRGLSTY